MKEIEITKEINAKNNKTLISQMKKYYPFYLFLIPALIIVILFSYVPMYGIIIAFKDFKMARGILGSEWVGLAHFQKIFSDPNFYRVLFNTIKLSVLSLVTSFPVTIIFALLVNELMNMKFKRVVQTITYLPHFLSWVVVGGFVYQLLSPSNGLINSILVSLGVIDKSIYFMVEQDMFTPIFLITNLWKSTGYSIVIYLAAIAGIDQGLYEAAIIDGANRFQRVLYVTLPALAPTICTLLILNISSLMSVGFDPIFNLYNPATYPTADVIATYVYRKGMVEAQYDLTTAIGLFQNVVGVILILFSNWLARKANPDYRII
ncbi:MAG: ABC transporter permease [Zhenhengia sp.]|jgi:putative aldouronate transport system permease protein|uniref:ABC transporter permease n=1 Tax=Zhenhengia sp. TaxID=2944208 RepID=UPI00290EC559|nr:sugar ABC transporter permease [Clostridiales bacterium]MDU6854667.1 ABC transporter permease subunit [Clostridiales bacterium]MDU6974491.1 ABC transporter permease subunit [Clostridiales bacterium]